MAALKKYPDELRALAVRLYRESGPKPVIRQLARQLGVHHQRCGTGAGGLRPMLVNGLNGLNIDLLEENRRLAKENAHLVQHPPHPTRTGLTRPDEYLCGSASVGVDALNALASAVREVRICHPDRR